MKHRRKIYLEDISLEEAQDRFFKALEQAGSLRATDGEWVSIQDAVNRISSEPIWALVSSPHYHASAMDGYAVRAADTHGTTETNPKRLRIGSQAAYVDTGDPLPPDTNAVIPIEQVQLLPNEPNGSQIEILAPVAPWQHVRVMGEDMVASELVIPENRQLGPAEIGAIAGCGHARVRVRRRPTLAIQPTGTELVAPGHAMKPGEIIEYNSMMLAAQANNWGAIATGLPPVPDELDKIKQNVSAALKTHDLVIINAGSSAGSEDFTAQVIESLGQVLVHGVAIRPGHPVVLGISGGKPLLGIPGYPVSAMITFELFVKPIIHKCLGLPPPVHPTAQATLTRKVVSPIGVEEFQRVALGWVGGRLLATPVGHGAGIISSLVRSDGMMRVPRFSEGVEAQAEITVELMRPPEEIRRTILAIGSHDLTLDLLASHLAKLRSGVRLATASVGSLGGLMALGRREAHLAGSHLLDEETGEYNLSYVKKYLSATPVVVLGFVFRQQGLMVAPGNPKEIRRIEDLLRDDVIFVNRQRGAGTRVLLDFELKRRGIDSQKVNGYERQEFTHTAVAAAVASGMADCGLGILAASRALALDFIPLLQERYDLIIPREHFDSKHLEPLIEVIRSTEFRDEVEAMGGYSTEQMGKVLAEFPVDGS